MKHNKLLTLSLLASFLILISASFATAQNTLSYGSIDVCPMPAGSHVYVPVTVDNDVDLAAADIVGQTVTISGGVTLMVTGVTFNNRMSDVNILDQRYGLSILGGGEFRFGAVKLNGADLATGSGQIAVLELEFVSDCVLGSAGIDPADGNCDGHDVTTAFVDNGANGITPTVTSGAVNVVDAPPVITSCPGDYQIYWNGGNVDVMVEADDPDLACGCDALTFSKVSGPGSITSDGHYTYTADAADIGCNTVEVQVSDEYGAVANCSFDISVLNEAPEFSGIQMIEGTDTSTAACGDTVFTVWDANITLTMLAQDPDMGPQPLSYSLINWSGGGTAPTIDANTGEFNWNIPMDPLYWGDHDVTVVVTDGAPLDACNEVNADTCSFTIRVYGFYISIEKVHDQLQGQTAEVSIYLDSALIGAMPPVSGSFYSDNIAAYDFLVAYDASALSFQGAAPGDLITSSTPGESWEYFTYRYGAQGNCGTGCPSGMLEVIAFAEWNNGVPYTGHTDSPGELAKLTFFVSNDRTLECQYVPISFYWTDCTDNAISDESGKFLFLGDSVFNFEGTSIPTLDDTLGYGYDGAEPYCYDTVFTSTGAIKNHPLRALVFRNGGVDIICAGDIDDRGDINQNGVANEIADAVMFTNYFIEGVTAFGDPSDPVQAHQIQGSIAASDVNADGRTLSVADLVYLVRIIQGDANPYPKVVPDGDMMVSTQLMNNTMNIGYQAADNVGAMLLTFDVNGSIGEPVLADGVNMGLAYGMVDGKLRVLVYPDLNSETDNAISSGSHSLLSIPVSGSIKLDEVEAAGFWGNTLTVTTHKLPSAYAVAQNYPNPFNPTTTIELSMPVGGEYNLVIYNINGQVVRSFSGSAPAGVVSLVWDGTSEDGTHVASGIYFYKAHVGNYTDTKKMVLMK
jgi:hypothetical protein